jgi:hypothetical protein
MFPPDRISKVLQAQRPIGVAKHRVHGEFLQIPRHQPIDGLMVEGGQKFYKPKKWLVWDSQTKGAIHLLDHSRMLTVWREGLIQVFKIMDSLGIHSGDLQKELQLGSNNFQTIEHMCIAGSDVERRGGTHFPHGIVPS